MAIVRLQDDSLVQNVRIVHDSRFPYGQGFTFEARYARGDTGWHKGSPEGLLGSPAQTDDGKSFPLITWFTLDSIYKGIPIP